MQGLVGRWDRKFSKQPNCNQWTGKEVGLGPSKRGELLLHSMAATMVHRPRLLGPVWRRHTAQRREEEEEAVCDM